MASAVLALAVLGAGFGGCQQTSHEARNAIGLYQIGDYAAAEATLKPTITKKDENYVLNNCRYGSAAIAAGDLMGAENAFFTAYQVMNSTNVNDSGRTAGATVIFEGVKVWLGEPFERAMAHYYLGVTFLIKHDYENARAAFQNSLFKLRSYANKDDLEHYQAAESNFAMGYFGLGFCYLRLGRPDLAAANFQLAEKNDPRLVGVIRDVQAPNVNALVFVDYGSGPRRAPKGWYNEESAFGPTPAEVGPIGPVELLVDGQIVTHNGEAYHMVDTLAMAQEQRWQDIDTIRKTKAVIGTGAMAAGAGVTAYGAQRHDTGTALAGLGVMALGAALAASSQADVRYWETLPRTVYVVPASLKPGPHEILVRAGGSQSAPLTVTIPPVSPGTRQDNVFYFRLLR
jgi:tetratricopeptide (TPR) repeat protein